MPSNNQEISRAESRRDAGKSAIDATREYISNRENSIAPQTSQQLGGFRLLRELGRGGMGTVYEAEDVSLGRRVALKVLRFGALADSAAVERFQREAATVAKLHHTNIVPIFSVGTIEGVHFYAMQFIEGRNLADVVREGHVAFHQAAKWGLQATEALAHAHQHGIIHRDVKPSNILVDGDDRIWLTDFGLARRHDDPALTATDALLGTPRYMSPEQASLKRSEVDGRTDIYSLGAALYELLTGRPAFDGESSLQVIQMILAGDPKLPRRLRSEVPADLETIVMKCLARQPARRYASASDVADELRRYLAGEPIRATRAFSEPGWLKVQQGLAMIVVSLMTIVSVVLLMAFLALWVPGALSGLPNALRALGLLSLLGKWRCTWVPAKSGLRPHIFGACLALTYSWLYAAAARFQAAALGTGLSSWTASLVGLMGLVWFLYFLSRMAKISLDTRLIGRAKGLLLAALTVGVAFLALAINPQAASRTIGALRMSVPSVMVLLLFCGALFWLWCYAALMSSLGEKIRCAHPLGVNPRK